MVMSESDTLFGKYGEIIMEVTYKENVDGGMS